MSSRTRQVAVLAVVVALATVPLIILGIQLGAWLSASRWVPVDARVLNARVIELQKFPRFRLEIRYAYIVGGVRYESDNNSSAPISMLGRFSSAEIAAKQLKAFPLGAIVTGYTNPSSPTTSALALESPGLFELLLAISTVAILSVGRYALKADR